MASFWKILLIILVVGLMSVFFLKIMRPPGGQASRPGQDLPWQVTVSHADRSLTVFGLTLGQSTLQDAVNKLGRRYDLGIFQDKTGRLSLEAYFRDTVVGGLNARLVLSAHLPEIALNTMRSHSGHGEPAQRGERRFIVSGDDAETALSAVIMAITYMPVVKFDVDLVRQRFGEPDERIMFEGGAHWLYSAMGLDLLLGDDGEALLQYVPPSAFEARLRAPLRKNKDSGDK